MANFVEFETTNGKLYVNIEHIACMFRDESPTRIKTICSVTLNDGSYFELTDKETELFDSAIDFISSLKDVNK